MEDFDYYRSLYIKALNTKVFPWEAAYYYYTVHIDRIDIMSFDEFKDSVIEESQGRNEQDSLLEISLPIYEAMDRFYSPVYLMTKEEELIKIT